MPARKEADAAIKGLDNTELKGRTIIVNQAKPRRGGGRGGRGGRGRQGGYNRRPF